LQSRLILLQISRRSRRIYVHIGRPVAQRHPARTIRRVNQSPTSQFGNQAIRMPMPSVTTVMLSKRTQRARARHVLVAIVKKRLALDVSLYKLLQIFSITLFEKTPILSAVSAVGSQFNEIDDCNQLYLFNL
jgi:hypothetical protein